MLVVMMLIQLPLGLGAGLTPAPLVSLKAHNSADSQLLPPPGLLPLSPTSLRNTSNARRGSQDAALPPIGSSSNNYYNVSGSGGGGNNLVSHSSATRSKLSPLGGSRSDSTGTAAGHNAATRLNGGRENTYDSPLGTAMPRYASADVVGVPQRRLF